MDKKLERITRLAPLGVLLAVLLVAALLSAPAASVPASEREVQAADSERTPATKRAKGRAARVQGRRLVDAAGRRLQLRGVNRSGSEYACAQGWGIFDGPSYNTANLTQPRSSIGAMKRWGINSVRVPLNEHCWLGINGVDPGLGGEAYRRAIHGYVKSLLDQRMRVILSLQVSGPGRALNDGSTEYSLPSADHAPDFWRSVAETYRSEPAVLFDLYNEPHLYELNDGVDDSSDAHWRCWRDGCSVPRPDGSGRYQAAGMQQLVDSIRGTDAKNVILAGGLGYANNLSRFDEYAPNDPADQLAASFHNYPAPLGECTTAECWNRLPKRFPTITGELGENDCAHGYVDQYMDWADSHGRVSYLAWTWNATDNGHWDCGEGPALIERFDGTPTPYGVGVRDHYQSQR